MLIAGAGSGKNQGVDASDRPPDPKSGCRTRSTLWRLRSRTKRPKKCGHRIEQVVGSDARNLWMGTFPLSLCAVTPGRGPTFLDILIILPSTDTDDSKSLIRSIVKEMGWMETQYKANTVYNRISAAKNRLISWQGVPHQHQCHRRRRS